MVQIYGRHFTQSDTVPSAIPTTVTRTVKSSGGDYTALAAFEAGEQRDLVAAHQIAQAECYDFLDVGGDPVFAGWTLNATHYVDIIVAAGNMHNGTRGTGYRRAINGFGHGVEISQDFVRVTGIAVVSDNVGGIGQWGDRGFHIDCGASSDIRISKCYETEGLTNDHSFIRVFNASGGVKVWNNIGSADLTESGSLCCGIEVQSTGAFYFYNNTFLGNNTGGFSYLIGNTSGGSPLFVCKNNVLDRGANPNATAGCYLINAATTTGSTNNLTDDATAPGSNPITAAFPAYVDETNGDLHLASGDTVCKNVGADLSADANIPFSDDIDGDSRPQGASWDVGADEY